MKTRHSLHARVIWPIFTLLLASLACDLPGYTRASDLAEDELQYIQQAIGMQIYDIAPPANAVNDSKCLPEITAGTQRSLENFYQPGEDRYTGLIIIKDNDLTFKYTPRVGNIFCRTTDANLHECIEFKPDGYDLRVYTAIDTIKGQINPAALCYALDFRSALTAAVSVEGPVQENEPPDQQPESDPDDACNITAYLELHIEVTQNIVNQYNTHICNYSVIFTNTHESSAGIPIIKVRDMDCFQNLDTDGYWALDSIPPGGQVTWMGSSSDHDDKDCPSRISGQFLELAGMVTDNETCVQEILRSAAFRTGYTDQIGFPFSAPPADCPRP